MTAVQKLQDRLDYIDQLIDTIDDVRKLEYLAQARAYIKQAINEPGDINIDADNINIDLSTVSNEIEQASNLQNVSSLLTDIENAVDGIEALVNYSKSSGNTDSNTIRVVLALNDLLFTLLGDASQTASATGSIHAKLRNLNNSASASDAKLGFITTNTDTLISRIETLLTVLGTAGDAASATGSVHAKLRQLANLLTAEERLTYTSIGTNVSANIKNSSTRLYSIFCTNLSNATRYLMLFNSTGATSSPVAVYPVYGNGGLTVLDTNFFSPFRTFSTGLTFGFSVQPTVFEAGQASDCILEVRYV